MPSKKTSAAEIAKRAGVSPATVSRVLNHPEQVKADTVQKVEEAASYYGITLPKAQKKTEETQEQHPLILLNCPSAGNPFYEEVLSGVLASASAHGYSVLLNYDAINIGNLHHFIGLVKQIHASGVILLTRLHRELLLELMDAVPVVQCSEYNHHVEQCPYVSINNEEAAYHAVKYLIGCGRSKVALINGPQNYKYSQERLQGYHRAMEEEGLSIPSNWVVHVPRIDYDMAFTVVSQIFSLDRRPNAFFASSDVFAAAVINAANKIHIRVPEDVMVVGFDNIALSQMMNPTITTVSQPKFQMGYTACELLCERLSDPDAITKSMLLSTEMIVRRSTAAGK